MAINTVKTVHFDIIEEARSGKIPWTPMAHSLLNEKFGIEEAAEIPAGEYPHIGYLVIGNGGHRNVNDGQSSGLFDILQHKVTDAVLFNHIPFIMRERANDLSAAERSRYRLRRLEEHNGTEYWVYYMRLTNISAQSPIVDILETDKGNTTVTPYEPSPSQLNPTPVAMVDGEVTQSSGRQIRSRIPISIEFDNAEINEIIDAVQIIYGDVRLAAISEVGICTGHDSTVVSSVDGQTYQEVIQAQIANFIGELNALGRGSQRLALSYDIANTVPYLV